MVGRKNFAPEDIDDEFWDEPQQYADLADSLYAIKPTQVPDLSRYTIAINELPIVTIDGTEMPNTEGWKVANFAHKTGEKT